MYCIKYASQLTWPGRLLIFCVGNTAILTPLTSHKAHKVCKTNKHKTSQSIMSLYCGIHHKVHMGLVAFCDIHVYTWCGVWHHWCGIHHKVHMGLVAFCDIHVYTWCGVWHHWWSNNPGLLLNTRFKFALFIRVVGLLGFYSASFPGSSVGMHPGHAVSFFSLKITDCSR